MGTTDGEKSAYPFRRPARYAISPLLSPLCWRRGAGGEVAGGRRHLLNAEDLAAERRLIEASQKRPRQFARLYERYFDRVYAFALTRTGNRVAAEDVTAETFRRAFQNLAAFEWRGVPLSAWLFRIASNVASDLYREAGREAELDRADEPADGWEARFIQVEERLQLAEHVRRLPADQARVVIMRFAQGRSIKDIAASSGRSEGAIKALQARALRSLREWLRESR